MSKEADRAARFASTKTYLTALKKEAEWEVATPHTLQAMDQLEWFDEYYLWIVIVRSNFCQHRLKIPIHNI